MPLSQYSLQRLQTLQPSVQPIFNSFLAACENAGVPCDVVQGTRTHAEQADIYNDGRTEPGRIVTYAPPGDSYHQYGVAIDAVPRAYRNLPDWNPTGPLWLKIGTIAEGMGLTWGGRWKTPDRPHFHLTAAPISEFKAYWEKFKQVMPVSVTPTIGGAAIIVMVLLAWFYLKPRMQDAGIL